MTFFQRIVEQGPGNDLAETPTMDLATAQSHMGQKRLDQPRGGREIDIKNSLAIRP